MCERTNNNLEEISKLEKTISQVTAGRRMDYHAEINFIKDMSNDSTALELVVEPDPTTLSNSRKFFIGEDMARTLVSGLSISTEDS